MKTIRRVFAAMLLVAALVLFGGLLAYGEPKAKPTPTPPLFPDCNDAGQGKCAGTCPTLWAPGTPNAEPVQPFTDRAHPDPCHKIQGDCTCAYRFEPRGTFYCHPAQGDCDGGCPNLYRTAQDAQNGVNPIDFVHHRCSKDSPTVCACYYY